MLDIIITHYKEPWEVCRAQFTMLDMQRHVDWKEIRETAANYPDLPVIRTRAEELLENLAEIKKFSGSDAEKQMQELAHLQRLAVKEQNEGKTNL